jgi:hypothetical protein
MAVDEVSDVFRVSVQTYDSSIDITSVHPLQGLPARFFQHRSGCQGGGAVEVSADKDAIDQSHQAGDVWHWRRWRPSGGKL